jgi:hypothetical protein
MKIDPDRSTSCKPTMFCITRTVVLLSVERLNVGVCIQQSVGEYE